MKKMYIAPCVKVKAIETENLLDVSGSLGKDTTIGDTGEEGDPDEGNTAKENTFNSWSED